MEDLYSGKQKIKGKKCRCQVVYNSLFFFFIVFLVVNFVAFSQTRNECNYTIDTLLSVKYGDSLYMLKRNSGNPSFFYITAQNIFVFEYGYDVLIFDKYNKFVKKKHFSKKIQPRVLDAVGNEDGLILLGAEKAYFADRELDVYDSIEYPQSCFGRNVINIRNKIYFYNSSELHTLVEFDIVNRLFKIVDAATMWSINECSNFPSLMSKPKVLKYNIGGSTGELFILWKGLQGLSEWEFQVALFNTKNCSMQKLKGFNYPVNLTTSSSNSFRFVNDSTAVFNVQNCEYKPLNHNKDCVLLQKGINEQFQRIETDCVFYRIKFSKE